MAQRSIATIDDGNNEPSKLSDIPQGRKPEPERIAGFEVHSPGDTIESSASGDGIPRRRGRPIGSRNRATTETKTPQNIAENLERLLLSVHTMGAAMLSCPELDLDESEAKKLASAIREVSKYYPITMDPKRLAFIELGTVAAMIYGTRGVAIYRRISAEQKKPKPAPTPIREASKPAQQEPPKKQAPERPLNPSDLFGVNNGVEDLSQL